MATRLTRCAPPMYQRRMNLLLCLIPLLAAVGCAPECGYGTKELVETSRDRHNCEVKG